METSEFNLHDAAPRAGRLTLFFLSILCLAVFSGCGSGAGGVVPPPPSPTLQSIAVSPQTMTLTAGLTQQYTATGTFSDGSSAQLGAASWATSNTALATASQSGLVTALKQGMVTVTATMGTVSGSAQLTVAPPIPKSFAISPATAKILIGSAPTKLSAILTFTDGSTTDVSSSATWTNANSFTATVDGTGNVTPVRLGATQVTAKDGTFSATAGVIVVAAPRYLYFTGEAASLASKAIIDSSSGVPHMAGFIPTGVVNGNFPCPTTDPLNQFLYVGSSDTANQLPAGTVQIYSIDPASGNLSALAGSPFAFDPGGGCIDFEPTGKFGYATVGVNSTTLLLTYTRDSITGGLTLTNSMNLGGVPFREAIDPLGQYLYVDIFTNNFGSAAALGFSIDATAGALTAIPGASFALSNVSGTFTFHPSGNFVFMANTNGASIDTYSVSRATGALSPASTIATCINPTPLRFSPDGSFAYSTCSENSSHVFAPSVESFSVGANGVLTHLSSQPVPKLASDLTVDPSGAFLYISTLTPSIFESAVGANGQAGPVVTIGAQSNPSQNTVVIGGSAPVKYTPLTAYITSSGDNTLSTYSLNSDGTLTLLQAPPMSTPASPFSLSLSPSGTNLVYASGVSSANISIVPLSSAGLTSSTQTLTTFGTPGGAVIDPAGQFAFEINSTDHTIHAYAPGTGNVWFSTGQDTPTSIGTGPIAMDPTGLLVFVANAGSGSVSVYQNFGLSSELLATAGSPFSVCTQPLFMAADPFKPFLYVACSDQTLRVMSVNYQNGGALTQAASVQLGALPTGLTVTANGNFVYASEGAGVSAFSVNATSGALTSVPQNPTISLANITGVYAEPSGRFLYVTTGSPSVPGAVFGFSVNADGTLTSISAQPLATPKLPTSMVFLDSIH